MKTAIVNALIWLAAMVAITALLYAAGAFR